MTKTPEEQIAELKQSLAQAQQKKNLRDEFAIAAMHVVGANTAYQRPIDSVEAARTAYQIADDIRDVIGNADDLGKPISQDQKYQRPNAVHSTQLTDAIDCFNTLIVKTVESIPNCSHQQFLKELVLQQADRLIPKAAI